MTLPAKLCTLTLLLFFPCMDAMNLIPFTTNNYQSPFIHASHDITHHILSYSHNPHQEPNLKKHCQSLVSLRTICKYFNEALTPQSIGILCKSYNYQVKNELFKKITDAYCPTQRFSSIILIYAGADVNIKLYQSTFLGKAVAHQDTELVEILLNHNADPNEKSFSNPLFFGAENIEIVQMLINKGLDVHATGYPFNNTSWITPNVLWKVVEKNSYSSELLALYLQHNVDTRIIDADGACLLHKLIGASAPFFPTTDINNFINKIKLLRDVIPCMINIKNKYNETPLDIAQNILKFSQEEGFSDQSHIAKQIIALLKKIALLRIHDDESTQEPEINNMCSLQ